MTPAELNRAIAERRIPPLLFFYGEETFLLEQALARLRDALLPTDVRDFNLSLFRGREAAADVVLDTARTFPVFHSHRLVLLREVQELPASTLDAFLPYLASPSPETVLLLVADKIDSRRKFFQEFKKHGELVEFKRLYDNQIPAFVQERCRAEGRSFTEEALALFCRRTGNGLQEIAGELEKLTTYLGERTLIDVADVSAVVTASRTESVFDLTNALGRRDPSAALRLLARLLEEGTVPLVLLTMVARHFRQLWQARECLDQQVPSRDIARRISINPYFVDGIVSQARSFPAERYPKVFELLLEADLALKSCGAHPDAMLERLVLDIVAETGQGRG